VKRKDMGMSRLYDMKTFLNALALKLSILAVHWLRWQNKDIRRITRSICRLRPVPAQESAGPR
jgi:hypothetical protein